MGQSMGLGEISSPLNIFKRKFRWTFTLDFSCDGTPYTFQAFNAATAARPKIEVEEFEVNYLGQRIKLPGSSAHYEPMEITLYDVANNDSSIPLYVWISNFMRLSNPRNAQQPSNDFLGTVTLDMLDGCGEVIESWSLEMCWPQSVDFGELDMASSDVCKIDISLIYNLATQTISEDCNTVFIPPLCCEGISGVSMTSEVSMTPDVALPNVIGIAQPNGSITPPFGEWFPISPPDLRNGIAYIVDNIYYIDFRCPSPFSGDCLTGANAGLTDTTKNNYVSLLNARYNCTFDGNSISPPEINGNRITYTLSYSGCGE